MLRPAGFGFLTVAVVLVGSPLLRADVVDFQTLGGTGSSGPPITLSSGASGSDDVVPFGRTSSASSPSSTEQVLDLNFASSCLPITEPRCDRIYDKTLDVPLQLTNQVGETQTQLSLDTVTETTIPGAHNFDVVPNNGPLVSMFTDGEVWNVNLEPVSLTEGDRSSNTAPNLQRSRRFRPRRLHRNPSQCSFRCRRCLCVGIAVRRHKRAGKMFRGEE